MDYLDESSAVTMTNRSWQYIVTALQLSCSCSDKIINRWKQEVETIPVPTPQEYEKMISEFISGINHTALDDNGTK